MKDSYILKQKNRHLSLVLIGLAVCSLVVSLIFKISGIDILSLLFVLVALVFDFVSIWQIVSVPPISTCKCQRCGEHFSMKFNYCPYCGIKYEREKRQLNIEEQAREDAEEFDDAMEKAPEFDYTETDEESFVQAYDETSANKVDKAKQVIFKNEPKTEDDFIDELDF